MDELVSWLASQHSGLKTYRALEQKALRLGASDHQHRALFHLLASLASDFIAAFEENPLPADVADEAFKRLNNAVRTAASSIVAPPADQLKALNEIAAVRLTDA